MITDGTDTKPWTAIDKQRLIDLILKRVYEESPFVEKSAYTIETLRVVLQEEL